MKIKLIACEVMKDEILSVSEARDSDITFIPMGLHLHPEKLNTELQRQLDSLEGYTHIILAFGLCGGAARKLKSKDSVIIIPKVHDCIPILLGSVKAYESIRSQEPGTYYYSCGWFKGKTTILSDYEGLLQKCGEEEALEIMKEMYDGYKNIVFIRTGHPDEELYIKMSKDFAKLLGLCFIPFEGQKCYIEKLVKGPWNDDEFIISDPGQELDDRYFY